MVFFTRSFFQPIFKINKISIFFVLLFCYGCSSNLEPIPSDKISMQEKQFAEKMANLILERCDAYDYSALSEEVATPEMSKGFNATVFQQTCELLKNKYGRFRGLEFVEAVKPPDSNQYVIYRFKGNFKDATKFPEIRITVDQSGKLAGFFTTKWKDRL